MAGDAPSDHVDRHERLDRLTALRRRVCPALHDVAQQFGGYVQCTMHPSEYVGTVDRSLEQFRTDLRSMAFRPEPVAALKRHRDGRQSAGSWVHRHSLLAEKQLHVTLFFAGESSVETYAHWEHSWIRHPIDHYRASGWDTSAGVETMRTLLRTHGISFRESRP
ncbi:hypothetical protein [Natrialba sp. SSL1]|uniref:hypothetical protein n=1 Tax=Natrialba sp. SSL1 TaxID=1869245 RepID=UPI0008F7F5A8|nr:hypothetical protein [Natrialba sp. SSL1]OIB58104.1 hypothetical protein BBD46_10210 [Natrialba sp. SSL1]